MIIYIDNYIYILGVFRRYAPVSDIDFLLLVGSPFESKLLVVAI